MTNHTIHNTEIVMPSGYESMQYLPGRKITYMGIDYKVLSVTIDRRNNTTIFKVEVWHD